jgi:hypothetical protein
LTSLPLAEHHHGRVVVARLLGRDLAISDDDHLVARLHEPRGGPIHRDVTRAARRLDRVGCETSAGIDVEHIDPLARQDAGEVQQVAVDGDRALVIEIGAGHGRPMQLRLQHGEEHWSLSLGPRGR